MSRILPIILAASLLLPLRANGSPENLDSGLKALVKELPWKVGLSVFDTDNEKEVAAYKSDENLKPASVLKILTTYAALDTLGPEYTFKTGVFGDLDDKGFTKELIIKGGGDPNLTLEEIWKIGRALRGMGVKSVGSLKIDDSLFESKSPTGIRAYEAGSAPLACSFNSVLFKICPASKGQRAFLTFEPIEANVTIEGSIITTGKNSSPSYSVERAPKGEFAYKVSGGIPEDAGCVQLFRNVTNSESYCMDVMTGIFSSLGISIGKDFKHVSASGVKASMLYEHHSAPLASIVRGLNHFSTNFIAEEIVYSLGQKSASSWSYSEGLQKIALLAKSLGFPSVLIQDGSGLSHENKIPPKLVSLILSKASKDERFGPELEASLPIAGKSGTLKKRDFGSLEGFFRGKTGSLDGVSSLAGYVRGESGTRYAFTIFQNGATSKDKALEIEQKVARRLAELG